MDNTDKATLRFYIAIFSSVFFHSVLMILLFSSFPDFKPKEKTIPIQLISSDIKGSKINQSHLSRADNALAAQEFLRTLNESTFEQLIKENTQKPKSRSSSNTQSPFKDDISREEISINQPLFYANSNPSSAFQGLRDIFNQKKLKEPSNANIQQISSKSLDTLTDYEILLLQALAKDELYDNFHPIMARKQQESVEYVITLQLMPNGAIRSASIKQSSNILEIDELAIKTAYQASPFPEPPKDDIAKRFRYDIPIIYQKRNTQ